VADLRPDSLEVELRLAIRPLSKWSEGCVRRGSRVCAGSIQMINNGPGGTFINRTGYDYGP
jgi:hypothetical protein